MGNPRLRAVGIANAALAVSEHAFEPVSVAELLADAAAIRVRLQAASGLPSHMVSRALVAATERTNCSCVARPGEVFGIAAHRRWVNSPLKSEACVALAYAQRHMPTEEMTYAINPQAVASLSFQVPPIPALLLAQLSAVFDPSSTNNINLAIPASGLAATPASTAVALANTDPIEVAQAPGHASASARAPTQLNGPVSVLSSAPASAATLQMSSPRRQRPEAAPTVSAVAALSAAVSAAHGHESASFADAAIIPEDMKIDEPLAQARAPAQQHGQDQSRADEQANVHENSVVLAQPHAQIQPLAQSQLKPQSPMLSTEAGCTTPASHYRSPRQLHQARVHGQNQGRVGQQSRVLSTPPEDQRQQQQLQQPNQPQHNKHSNQTTGFQPEAGRTTTCDSPQPGQAAPAALSLAEKEAGVVSAQLATREQPAKPHMTEQQALAAQTAAAESRFAFSAQSITLLSDGRATCNACQKVVKRISLLQHTKHGQGCRGVALGEEEFAAIKRVTSAARAAYMRKYREPKTSPFAAHEHQRLGARMAAAGSGPGATVRRDSNGFMSTIRTDKRALLAASRKFINASKDDDSSSDMHNTASEDSEDDDIDDDLDVKDTKGSVAVGGGNFRPVNAGSTFVKHGGVSVTAPLSPRPRRLYPVHHQNRYMGDQAQLIAPKQGAPQPRQELEFAQQQQTQQRQPIQSTPPRHQIIAVPQGPPRRLYKPIQHEQLPGQQPRLERVWQQSNDNNLMPPPPPQRHHLLLQQRQGTQQVIQPAQSAAGRERHRRQRLPVAQAPGSNSAASIADKWLSVDAGYARASTPSSSGSDMAAAVLPPAKRAALRPQSGATTGRVSGRRYGTVAQAKLDIAGKVEKPGSQRAGCRRGDWPDRSFWMALSASAIGDAVRAHATVARERGIAIECCMPPGIAGVVAISR
jgi:hypothetical protein